MDESGSTRRTLDSLIYSRKDLTDLLRLSQTGKLACFPPTGLLIRWRTSTSSRLVRPEVMTRVDPSTRGSLRFTRAGRPDREFPAQREPRWLVQPYDFLLVTVS